MKVQDAEIKDESLVSGYPTPWHVLLYLCAFVLLFNFDWKIGAAWLFWRTAHSLRIVWERKVSELKQEAEQTD